MHELALLGSHCPGATSATRVNWWDHNREANDGPLPHEPPIRLHAGRLSCRPMDPAAA